MDIQAVRSLLELKAMQNLNTASSSNTSVDTENNYFTEMLSELLESGDLDELTNMLGGVSTLLNATSNGSSTNEASSVNNNAYLASFLLNGNTAQQAQAIQSYSIDYTNQKGYDNIVEGAEKYADIISNAATTYNVPEKLISAVMKQESNFNASAVSSAGATGLMQLMPSTAKYLGATNASDPEQNVMAGAKYLRQMLDKFDDNVSLALAAYNAGPGNVSKYNGIPPFKETQNYVKNVMQYYQT